MPSQKSFSVVITDCDFASFEQEKKELEDIAEVNLYQCRTEAEVIQAAHNADGLLVQYAPITRNVIASLKKCKVISRYGTGIDSIDLQAATDHGIQVVNVPGYCIEEVSDHAIALILACIRKLFVLDNAVKRGRWDVRVADPIYRFQDCTIGLIGFGAIAKRIVQKLQAFGCSFIAYKPRLDSELFAQYNVKPVSFEELLRQADVISIHAPLIPETKHMFGEREFRLMKESGYLINTSRGGIIDEEALYTALKGKWIAGAALDVVSEEPLNARNALLTLENIIITPHAAFYSLKAISELQKWTARGVAQSLRGEIPTHLVNRELVSG